MHQADPSMVSALFSLAKWIGRDYRRCFSASWRNNAVGFLPFVKYDGDELRLSYETLEIHYTLQKHESGSGELAA